MKDRWGGVFQVVDIANVAELFRTPTDNFSYGYFSKNGEELIVYLQRKYLRIYNTADWRLISEIILPVDERYCNMIDDSHTVIVTSTENEPFGSPKYLMVKAIRCVNGKALWEWKAADKIMDLAGIDSDEKKRRIRFACANLAGKAEYYLIDYDSGHAIKTSECPPTDSDEPALGETKSKDGRYVMSMLMYSDKFVLRDDKLGEIVSEMNAAESRINCIGISGDAQHAAGIVDDNAVGIWTRRRQHFEWWGIYEQPESWLVVAMFGLLIWSIRRDWKALR